MKKWTKERSFRSFLVLMQHRVIDGYVTESFTVWMNDENLIEQIVEQYID